MWRDGSGKKSLPDLDFSIPSIPPVSSYFLSGHNCHLYLHIIFLFFFFLDLRSSILSTEEDAHIFRVLGEADTLKGSQKAFQKEKGPPHPEKKGHIPHLGPWLSKAIGRAEPRVKFMKRHGLKITA